MLQETGVNYHLCEVLNPGRTLLKVHMALSPMFRGTRKVFRI